MKPSSQDGLRSVMIYHWLSINFILYMYLTNNKNEVNQL